MNNMYERMKKLLSDAGISFEEGGYSNSEILAYASAVDYVKKYFDKILKKVFINIDDTDDMYEYLQMLNLRKSDYTTQELKNCIYSRLGMPFGDYTVSNFNKAFDSIGSGNYEITKSKIIFSDVDEKDLHKLGDFIESYIYLCKDFSYDGTGFTFDERDACNMTFYDCDKMNLPFDIIDTLRRVTNE